jgi:neutral ceramidase
MRRPIFFGLGLLALVLPSAPALAETRSVGVASLDVTPRFPIRMTGYGNRSKESAGVASPLKARALAFGGTKDEALAVLVTVDNCGVPAAITEDVARRLEKLGVARERFVLASTHTHCGPSLSGNLGFILAQPPTAEETARIERYTTELTTALYRVAADALAARAPGTLTWGRGSVDFAVNRRVLKEGKWVGFGETPDGAVDHDLPVLCVTDPNGKLRAVLANYACHCTTLDGNFNEICADWAGYACDAIESKHPGAVALITIGCGADANPRPRKVLSDAKDHGDKLATEAERVLLMTLKPLDGPIRSALRRIELPFAPTPTIKDYAERARKPAQEGAYAKAMQARLERGETLPTSMSYPVQCWSFGDSLSMVFLGGEVVVDYALRLKKEVGPNRLWITAYANDVPCYIPSGRVLEEGGYEADFSMIYYGKPTRLAPSVEDQIVSTVLELLKETASAR